MRLDKEKRCYHLVPREHFQQQYKTRDSYTVENLKNSRVIERIRFRHRAWATQNDKNFREL